MMLRAPAFMMLLLLATPAAPTPATTIFMSSIRFLTIFREFSSEASTTTAVPCWSSWKTGIPISPFRRSSISKQRGAEISSRLIPPKVGSSALTTRMISSGSFVLRQIGQASIPANSLNSIAFPSMTGIAASGPMSPRPSTAVPSETTATASLRSVRENDVSTSTWIAMHTRAALGVRHGEVVPGLHRNLVVDLDLAAEVHPEGPVGDVHDLHARDLLHGVDDLLRVIDPPGPRGDIAEDGPRPVARQVDRPDVAARGTDRGGHLAEHADLVLDLQPHRDAVALVRLCQDRHFFLPVFLDYWRRRNHRPAPGA